MVELGKIQDVMSSLESHIQSVQPDFIITRAEQGHDKPNYPFASYKIINSKRGQCYQDFQKTDEVVGDDTKAQITNTKELHSTVSITFLGIAYTELYSLTDMAIDYFQSLVGSDTIKALGLNLRLINTSVKDRTTISVNEFEHKLGFDVELEQYKDNIIIEDAIAI